MLRELNERTKRMQLALGRIESRQIENSNANHFNDFEFQVHSQWGEDGLIQYLIRKVNVEAPVFVEFGVENYREANTRFLLERNNWSGLVIDGSEKNINDIKQDEIYWKYNLKAECAFIDKDNINELIRKNGIKGDVGLLSVDIDGNDYWVWQSIDVISPRIVICEYNSCFGSEKSVTVPYDPTFFRTDVHYSNLYWGASISAFADLARSKGYSLIGSNIAGNNLFFVRDDVMGSLEAVSPQQAHTISQFRESRDGEGRLSFLSYEHRLAEIKEMPLIDLNTNEQKTIKDIYEL